MLSFQSLNEEHLDLLCIWLQKPHVKEWWNDGLTDEEIKAKHRKRIGDSIVVPYIVYLDHQPIGFIQYYFASKVGGGWWPNEKDSTVGIDQFIGEENYVNRGLGTEMVATFIKKLFENPMIEKIITEADPKNIRAKRCYVKAGFQFVKEIMTPDGLSELYEINRNDLIK